MAETERLRAEATGRAIRKRGEEEISSFPSGDKNLIWFLPEEKPIFKPEGLVRSVERFRDPVHIIQHADGGSYGISFNGKISEVEGSAEYRWIGTLPGLFPEWLGDQGFCRTHGARFSYIAGAMANGIATADLVVAMAKSKMLAFFGSAGLGPERTEENLIKIESALAGTDLSFGSNLIHTPDEPSLEEAMVDLYLRRGVRRVSASAFMKLSLPVVHYAVSGVHLHPDGKIRRSNYLFPKVSRPEVARHFMVPPPEVMLQQLVKNGKLTDEEARLGAKVPLAEDITVESDSGGHTDNRPLAALFSTMEILRDQCFNQHPVPTEIRLGAAGGLGTPQAVAAAYGLGAAYVLTGSVNQAAHESGQSELGRQMLAQAGIADVAMAPAADMFELGVKVQVLKKGTMWAVRGQRLFELYRRFNSWEEVPEPQRHEVEKNTLRRPFEEIWSETRDFFAKRDPNQVEKAERDPHHKMALVFRWYLGMASRWAIGGVADRQMDYQMWCGPAMGAFNDWVRGSFLEDPKNRSVVQIALNLLEGAAAITRAQQLRSLGVAMPTSAFVFKPRPLTI